MDMTKMGPMARKPTNEAKTRKDIEAFMKEEDALFAKKDYEAMLNRVDFPVFMLTDNLAGAPSARATSREDYLAEMKPLWESAPANTTAKHKRTITVLSDSLANVVDDYDMTMGKQKMKGRNAFIVGRFGNQWKVKSMMEAGWGDMGASPSGAAAPAPAPAPPPAGKAPPPPPAPAPRK